MKTTIIILWILFVFAIIIEADVGRKTRYTNARDAEVGTVCIDGYKFAYIQANGDNGVALVQMRQNSKNRWADAVARFTKCEAK